MEGEMDSQKNEVVHTYCDHSKSRCGVIAQVENGV